MFLSEFAVNKNEIIMNNSNPFSWLSPQTQKRALVFFGIAALILLITLSVVDQPLKNSNSGGIISYELAGTLERSQEILNSWDHNAKLFAAFSLGIDYLFMVAYSLFLALSIFKLSQNFVGRKEWLSRLGIYLAWAQFAAAVFDAIENYFLLRLMLGSQTEIFSALAFYSASIKFVLIFLGLIYIASALILRTQSKIKPFSEI